MMRKNKRDQKEFFQKLERGELDEDKPKEAKLLTRDDVQCCCDISWHLHKPSWYLYCA